MRVVYKIDPLLRRIHRTIAVALVPPLATLPSCVQGFRRGASILTHARGHCGKAVVLTVDLEDFFGNIHLRNVADVFERLGCARQPALLLARLCTYRETLPQGGRASPALSNLCASGLDAELLQRCGSEITYSRYADDLAFSGDSVPSEAELRRLIQPFGFSLRKGSYHLQPRNRGQFVTGLSVTGAVPSIPRRTRREMEAAVRFGEKNGIAGHLQRLKKEAPSQDEVSRYLRRLYGRINSYDPVEPELCKELRARLDRLTGADSPA